MGGDTWTLAPFDIGAIPDVVGRMKDAAIAETDLSDFGEEWPFENLRQLLWFAAMENGGLSSGDPAASVIHGHLVDRLRMVDFVKRNPAVLDEEVGVACVIASAARTGSTFLHGLLSATTQLNSIPFWEAISPLPLPGEIAGDPSARVKKAEHIVNLLRETAPNFEAMHHLSASEVDEELPFLDRTFRGVGHASSLTIPSYTHWMMGRDQMRSFEELRLWLKILQWQQPSRRGKRWVLKTPHYFMTGSVGTLMTCFPEAKIIWIHRRMDEAVPSTASLNASTLASSGQDVAMRMLGPHFLRIYKSAVDVLMPLREDAGRDRFVELRYRDVVKDAVATLEAVMPSIGLHVTDEDRAGCAEWIGRNVRTRGRGHSYTLEQFGVTERQLEEAFGEYHRLAGL